MSFNKNGNTKNGRLAQIRRSMAEHHTTQEKTQPTTAATAAEKILGDIEDPTTDKGVLAMDAVSRILGMGGTSKEDIPTAEDRELLYLQLLDRTEELRNGTHPNEVAPASEEILTGEELEARLNILRDQAEAVTHDELDSSRILRVEHLDNIEGANITANMLSSEHDASVDSAKNQTDEPVKCGILKSWMARSTQRARMRKHVKRALPLVR